MLIDNKERTIKLTAENFVNGNISFHTNKDKIDETKVPSHVAYDLGEDFNVWIKENEKDFMSSDMKKFTNQLFQKVLRLRVQGVIGGILKDTDLEEENKILMNENNSLKIINQELESDCSKLARELKDKTDLVEKYENSLGVGKK